jgi:hypothetical protein
MSKTTNVQTRAGEVGVRKVDIDKLRTLPGLLLTYDKELINDLTTSIEYSTKRFGKLLRPIIVSMDLYVLDGNAVITAAKQLGLREVDAYEIPVRCADDFNTCIGLYYVLNELRRKDINHTARRRAIYELVLRHLAGLANDKYARLLEKMYNDTVPTELIRYIRNLAPLPYGTIYRDLELFIVHPKLFWGMAQVRNTDIKHILSSIPDSIFNTPQSLIEVLKATPREKRTEILEGQSAASGNRDRIQDLKAQAAPRASEAEAKAPGAVEATSGAAGASGGASGASSINNIINNNSPKAVREAPVAPASVAPGVGVSGRGSLDSGSVVRYALDQLKGVKDRLRSRLEDYAPGLGEFDIDKLVEVLTDTYVIYMPRVHFMTEYRGLPAIEERMHALRYLIYMHMLDAFEDVMDSIMVDIRNTAPDEALVRLYGALRNADRRIGVGRARGPRGMTPYFAAFMCEVLKALDEISGNFYASGVERICKDVEEYVLRKFDDMRQNAR